VRAYFSNIATTISSLFTGLRLTWKHFLAARNSRKPLAPSDENYFTQGEGIATIQYPFEQMPVPDNGRYQLDNEIDDCIVCDKCAKVCPVNCIDIEPIRAVEEIGKTSDGTPKRIYAAKFDIDMAKCCFCGLCTTVCPTECLTMTSEYDFSTFDVNEHNFIYGNMSEDEIVEKKRLFEEFTAEKLKAKEAKALEVTEVDEKPAQLKIKRKLTFKPKIASAKTKVEEPKEESKVPVAKPKFKPKFKLKTQAKTENEESVKEEPKKVVFKPKFKPKKK